jgi:hypothetical protein
MRQLGTQGAHLRKHWKLPSKTRGPHAAPGLVDRTSTPPREPAMGSHCLHKRPDTFARAASGLPTHAAEVNGLVARLHDYLDTLLRGRRFVSAQDFQQPARWVLGADQLAAALCLGCRPLGYEHQLTGQVPSPPRRRLGRSRPDAPNSRCRPTARSDPGATAAAVPTGCPRDRRGQHRLDRRDADRILLLGPRLGPGDQVAFEFSKSVDGIGGSSGFDRAAVEAGSEVA